MEVEADVGTQQIPEAAESLFSLFDAVLLVLLLGLGTWWILKNRKKEEVSTAKSYTIQ